MTQKVSVTVRARLTPIQLGPDDVLLLEFSEDTNAEIMEAAVNSIKSTLRLAGRVNEVVGIPASIKVRAIMPTKKPRRVNGNLRPTVAKRRALA